RPGGLAGRRRTGSGDSAPAEPGRLRRRAVDEHGAARHHHRRSGPGGDGPGGGHAVTGTHSVAGRSRPDGDAVGVGASTRFHRATALTHRLRTVAAVPPRLPGVDSVSAEPYAPHRVLGTIPYG